VRPELVFELGFDGVESSGRRKAGLALRTPRVLRWLRDRDAAQAASLEALRLLLG
jgi:DNA ligase-1